MHVNISSRRWLKMLFKQEFILARYIYVFVKIKKQESILSFVKVLFSFPYNIHSVHNVHDLRLKNWKRVDNIPHDYIK